MGGLMRRSLLILLLIAGCSEPKEKSETNFIKEYVLEDGTRCVVLYRYGGIDCDWEGQKNVMPINGADL